MIELAAGYLFRYLLIGVGLVMCALTAYHGYAGARKGAGPVLALLEGALLGLGFPALLFGPALMGWHNRAHALAVAALFVLAALAGSHRAWEIERTIAIRS